MTKLIEKHLNRETVTYLIFGVLTTIIGFGLYTLLTWLGMSVASSNTISSILAVIFAFFANKAWVFQSASWAFKTVLREFLSFCAGRLATYIMETGLLILMVDKLSWPNLPCKGFTMVLVMIGNYIISKWAVFNKKST